MSGDRAANGPTPGSDFDSDSVPREPYGLHWVTPRSGEPCALPGCEKTRPAGNTKFCSKRCYRISLVRHPVPLSGEAIKTEMADAFDQLREVLG